jgi:hypothetical protein
MDLTKPERRKDPTSQLLRTMQEQNVMLAQILAFMKPITDFFNAISIVVKVIGAIAAGMGILWGSYQAVKEWFKLHP